MFGHRTPVKPSSVRRSIGDWEAGQVVPPQSPPNPPKTTPKTATVTKLKPMTALSQDSGLAARTAALDAAENPHLTDKPKFTNRLSEAKSCLTKAKLNLNSARNLKTEIKTAVTSAIERLYQLVKETEAEVTKLKDPIKNKGQSEVEKEVLTSPPPPPPLLPMVPGEDLKLAIESHMNMLKESNEQIIGLKKVLEDHRAAVEGTTYADKVAGASGKKPPTQTTLHSVVVTSKDEGDTGEQVLSKIRDTIQAKEGWVKVEKIRKTKDRKIIVGCKTREEREKVKERLRKAEEYLNVEEIKNKDPLIILKDVLRAHSDEDLLKALRNQNKYVFADLDKQDNRVEVIYRKKARNSLENHVVIRVSPKIYQRVLEGEAVYIDLQRIWVADQSPLVQCSLCLGYGHGRRFCNQTIVKCSHCGGPHMRSECADWLAGAPPSCSNCTQAKLAQNEHNAFSQECPVRRKWDALARSTIAYC